MTCTFFGHRDAPADIKLILRNALLDLIENQGVSRFYVGNQGKFDLFAIDLLKAFENSHGIEFIVVLPYLPKRKAPFFEDCKTILPEGIETTPPKFAIDFRNRWMIDHSEVVVTYVNRTFGGAYKFKCLAKRKDKIVIELSRE